MKLYGFFCFSVFKGVSNFLYHFIKIRKEKRKWFSVLRLASAQVSVIVRRHVIYVFKLFYFFPFLSSSTLYKGTSTTTAMAAFKLKIKTRINFSIPPQYRNKEIKKNGKEKKL